MPKRYPKRIILSRKGWDSKAGGRPSPIFPAGMHVSFPIPDVASGVRYADVRSRDGKSVGDLVERLSKKKATEEVHLDPDLVSYAIKRPQGFRAGFGQSGGAQTHLWNQGLRSETAAEDADLFLFFGWYQPVTLDCAKIGPPLHMIFGWLQVGEILRVGADEIPNELRRHPHVVPSSIVASELARRRESNNTLYVARERLTFAPNIPGAGVFGEFDVNEVGDPRRLTNYGETCSHWRLPSFFTSLSNMGKKQPAPSSGWWFPQRRGPGQEFVLDTSGCAVDSAAWIDGIFQHAAKIRTASDRF